MAQTKKKSKPAQAKSTTTKSVTRQPKASAHVATDQPTEITLGGRTEPPKGRPKAASAPAGDSGAKKSASRGKGKRKTAEPGGSAGDSVAVEVSAGAETRRVGASKRRATKERAPAAAVVQAPQSGGAPVLASTVEEPAAEAASTVDEPAAEAASPEALGSRGATRKRGRVLAAQANEKKDSQSTPPAKQAASRRKPRVAATSMSSQTATVSGQQAEVVPLRRSPQAGEPDEAARAQASVELRDDATDSFINSPFAAESDDAVTQLELSAEQEAAPTSPARPKKGKRKGKPEPEPEPEDEEAANRRFLKGLLEALLFSGDKPMTLRELGRAARLDRKRTQELFAELRADYSGRGMVLVEIAGGWSMRSNPLYAEYVQKMLSMRPVRLSRPQLETLAIIAYRQPITRPEVDDIRGVDSGPVIKGLLERDLLKVLGKKDEAGRPVLYGTADAFLELFSLESLKQLPSLKEFTELSQDSRGKFESEIGEPAPEGSLEAPDDAEPSDDSTSDSATDWESPASDEGTPPWEGEEHESGDTESATAGRRPLPDPERPTRGRQRDTDDITLTSALDQDSGPAEDEGKPDSAGDATDGHPADDAGADDEHPEAAAESAPTPDLDSDDPDEDAELDASGVGTTDDDARS